MKRKFTNVFFLVAIAVAAMTSFVSCKDYEDDLRTEFNAKYKDLDQSLQTLKSDLEKRVSDLEAFKTAQEGINKNLQDQIDDLKKKIAELDKCKCDLSEYAKKSDLEGLASQVDLDALEQLVQNYYNELKALIGEKCDCDARISALEEAIKNLKQCECNLDDILARLDAAEARLDNIEKNFVTRQELIDSLASVRRTIDLEVLDLQNQINAILIRLETVEGTAADALQLAKDDSVRIDKNTSRIDYVINLAKTDSIRIDNLQQQINNINTQGYDDTELRNLISTLETTLKSLIQSNTDRIKALEDLNIDSRLTALEEAIKNIKSCTCDLTDYAKKEDLTGFATKTELKEVRDSAMRALNLAKDDSIRIDALKKQVDGLDTSKYNDQWIKDQFAKDKERMDILGDSIKKIMTEMGNIKTSITTLETTLREKIKSDSTYLKGLIDAIEAKIPTIPDIPGQVDISTLRDSVKTLFNDMDGVKNRLTNVETEVAKIPGIQQDIKDLRSDLNKALDRIKNLETSMSSLTNKVNTLENRLNELITGIVVQAITNPVYGTFNTPFGFESNVLVSYYGTMDKSGFNFPTANPTRYYNQNEVAADPSKASDITVAPKYRVDVDENGFLFDNSQGNSGSIYLTINPTNHDFSGAEVNLVNSRGEKAPFTLTPLVQSNRLIDLGWSVTRAGGNGLYSTDVTISSDFVKAAPNWGITEDNLKAAYNDLKEAYKSAKAAKKNYKVAFTEIAKGLISSAGDVAGLAKMSAPAYALRTNWNNVETTSKYELAAVSIKPLSYSAANKLDEKNPVRKGIDALEKAIGKIASTIQKQISKRTDGMIFDVGQIENITNTGFDVVVKEAEITDLKGLTVTIPYSDIHEMFIVNPETGEAVYMETDGHQDIEATVVAAEGNKLSFQFHKSLSQYFKNMEAFLRYLHDAETESGYFDDLNDLLKWIGGDPEVEGDGLVEDLADKAISKIEKFASSFAEYFKPSNWLQPLAFVYDGKLKPLTSAGVDSPRIVEKTNVTLVLTSRTGELLVPAYKKWIAVTNVYNPDGTPAPTSVRDAANKGEINTILAGTKRHVSLSLQKGYVYELNLQCVDYFGVVSAKQYYVRVK